MLASFPEMHEQPCIQIEFKHALKVSTNKYIHNQCIGTNPPQIHKRITDTAIKSACDIVEL